MQAGGLDAGERASWPAQQSRDEALGDVAERYARLLDEIAAIGPARAASGVDAIVRRLGVSFRTPDGDAEFRVDPIPRIVSRTEWRTLAAGLEQRARALNAFIRDAYGEREVVAAGVMPGHAIDSAEHFEPSLRGVVQEHPAAVVGFDLVRGADGVLRVLEDNLRSPSGIAYACGARDALDAGLEVVAPDRLSPGDAYALLGRALERAAPRAGAAVVLTEGERSGAWFEHAEIARRIDAALIRPDQLELRDGRLVARLADGELDVAVAYRRTDEERLRGVDGEATWLQRLLVPPVRAGTLAVVNAIGNGVADDKLTHAYVERMIPFYLGERPLLESVTTYDLSREEERERMLARIDEIVIKPRSGLGGAGVFIGPAASAAEREAAIRAVHERPGELIAQETVALSTHPTVIGNGLEPRHVDLRAYVIDGEAAPVALTRFAPGRGDLVVNSSGGGGGKDTWILA